jgi:indolepyruvate ferredoxin oxidoreductase
MGGEGVNWVSRSTFNGGRHVFQNLGDGTFYHSGSVAIRQAVAAGTNITYKILFNDAVAMTGGQAVDGPLTVQSVAHSVRAEGVERIALVSDEPQNFNLADFPRGTTLSHRREMDRLQRELREIPGVTVLIYAQTCATEKRRQRKRGLIEDPKRVVVINELVCEGCGDCSVESNCLSVIPKETPFGRKRQIDQSNCNKDFSCLNGFCPSFVTVEGGERRRKIGAVPEPDLAGVAAPTAVPIEGVHDLLVTGVGGTGVVTVGALITMAAHLEGKGASVLDFMGFAQKFGPVLSYIRLSGDPAGINQVRIEKASADALIACDLVVSSSPKASRTYDPARTRAVLNTAEMATGDFVRHRDASLNAGERIAAIASSVADLLPVDANRLAGELMGDTIYANVLLLGAAFQAGLVPVSLAALERAIELNNVKIEQNKRAFAWGRLAAARPDRLPKAREAGATDESLAGYIERRAAFLVDYQDERLANEFRGLVARVQERENQAGGDGALTRNTAQAYFRLLAYKDEYEVARLHTGTGFLEKLREDYGDEASFHFHLAPPVLRGARDARGRPLKRSFGSWMIPVFRGLARLKRLRGGPFDVFGYSAERRTERALIREFEATVRQLLPCIETATLGAARAVIEPWLEIRGYGPVKDAAVQIALPLVAARLRDVRGCANAESNSEG